MFSPGWHSNTFSSYRVTYCCLVKRPLHISSHARYVYALSLRDMQQDLWRQRWCVQPLPLSSSSQCAAMRFIRSCVGLSLKSRVPSVPGCDVMGCDWTLVSDELEMRKGCHDWNTLKWSPQDKAYWIGWWLFFVPLASPTSQLFYLFNVSVGNTYCAVCQQYCRLLTIG